MVNRLAAGDRPYKSAYALRVVHMKSDEFYWLHRDLSVYQVQQKYCSLHPSEDWRYAFIKIVPLYGFIDLSVIE